MKLIMLQLMVGKPFGGGRRNERSSLQVGRHTQKNQEQPTHNLYEDDQGLDEKEDEKSEKMRLLKFRLNSYHKFCQMVEPKCLDRGLIKYFDKLGISLNEKYQFANVATYVVLGTVSIATTHRTNAMEMDQFERTLIVADNRRFVDYLEKCTVPSYDMNQLDAAVVELHCIEEAEIKYLTVQYWYADNENKKGGIYNFVIEKGLYVGRRSKDILKLRSTKQIRETCDTLSLTKLGTADCIQNCS
nr:uncharacterized protein [Tanacetum cinerariifolium]